MPDDVQKTTRRPRKGMGGFRDAAGRLWQFWRGRWREVKAARYLTPDEQRAVARSLRRSVKIVEPDNAR